MQDVTLSPSMMLPSILILFANGIMIARFIDENSSLRLYLEQFGQDAGGKDLHRVQMEMMAGA